MFSVLLLTADRLRASWRALLFGAPTRVVPAETLPVAGAQRWWPVLQFPLTRIVLAAIPLLGVQVAGQTVYLALGHSSGAGGAMQLGALGSLLVLAACAVSVPLYRGHVRLVERRRMVELGVEGMLGELGRGFVLGLALLAATVLILAAAGCARIERGAGIEALLPKLLLAIAAGISEEILFRGVLFRIVEERLGSWIALAVTAAMFGGFHLLNASASVGSTLAIALEAGILLAAAYMCTRRLWLPIAMHTGWNLAQGGIFGVPTAAHPVPDAWWSTRLSGPALLTGGDYGIDRSIVAVLICLAAAVALLVIARRRGLIVRPGWNRR